MHLVTPEEIDTMLAKIKADPIKAARLRLVWNRDEQKPEDKD